MFCSVRAGALGAPQIAGAGCNHSAREGGEAFFLLTLTGGDSHAARRAKQVNQQAKDQRQGESKRHGREHSDERR